MIAGGGTEKAAAVVAPLLKTGCSSIGCDAGLPSDYEKNPCTCLESNP